MRHSQRCDNAESHRNLRLAAFGVVALMLVLGLPAQAQTSSVTNGQAIFDTRCVACHSLDTNRVGPALGTVWGRAAGTASGFEYSTALGQATHRWSSEKLLAWLENPEALVPGQQMGYRVELASDRLDVVAFLASLAQAKPPQ